MALTVFLRFVYDDVKLVASVDRDSSSWALSVDLGAAPAAGDDARWVPIRPKILDNNLNWSTTDLAQWDRLHAGDEQAIAQAFPDARPSAPAGLPMAITWDISDWTVQPNPRTGTAHCFRFTDPGGDTYEVSYSELLSATDPIRIGA